MPVIINRIDKKISKLEQKRANLEIELQNLKELRRLSDLNIDNPDMQELSLLVEQAAEKFKSNPRKILAILMGKYKPVQTSNPAVVKYRDTAPGCENNTWSGRGLPPLWMKRYEAAGRNRADFLVK